MVGWATVFCAWVSAAQAGVFLKCEATDELTREYQDWFVDIQGWFAEIGEITSGATLILMQQYTTGENEWVYKVWYSDEAEIRASLWIENENIQNVPIRLRQVEPECS